MKPGFSKIEGEHSIADDAAAVNPNYGKTGYTSNCGNCAVAYELRRNGYDVEALPRKSGMSQIEFAEMFDGFVPIRAIDITSDASKVVDGIIKDIASWGDGARGTIRGAWIAGNRGHRFSVEVVNGRVVLVDGQVGKFDVDYLKKLRAQSIEYGRLDSLKPTENVKRVCTNRKVDNDT